ncbi:MAG: response regulator transcription factor [Chloroflexi bacterium]|nr:response regulator transcription factor [Chloroflexota bacterium]
MPQANYLLVSQNDALGQVLGHALNARWANLSTAQNSDEAFRYLERDQVEAIFVDARDVSECKPLRSRWRGPIVLLFNGDTKSAALRGYQIGADLALAIPCDSRELVARVRALTRRIALQPS